MPWAVERLDKDPKQLTIHRKGRTAPPILRLSIGTVLYSSVWLRGLPCHAMPCHAMSAFLLWYRWSYVATTGFQTCMLGSRLVHKYYRLRKSGGDPIAAVQNLSRAHRQKQVFCALGSNDQLAPCSHREYWQNWARFYRSLHDLSLNCLESLYSVT